LPLAETVRVGQFEFIEWTGENHLRHTRLMGLRHDNRKTSSESGRR
jgi:hypothetical protein